MNTINLLLVASGLLSLAFSYIPGLEGWYAGLDPTRKRLVMAGALLLSTIGIYAYGCAGRLTTDFTCDANAAWDLATGFVLAIMANQTTYSLLGKFGKSQVVEVRGTVPAEDAAPAEKVTATIEAEIKE